MKILLFSLACLFSAGTYYLTTITDPTRRLKGMVTDIFNKPLAGATIRAKDGLENTTTDSTGLFDFMVADSCKILTVSHAGFFSQDVRVTGLDSVSIKLISHATMQAVTLTAPPTVAYDYNIKRDEVHAAPYSTHTMSVTTEEYKMQSTSNYSAPSQFNTEDYNAIRENSFHATKNEPLSTFSVDVDKASYANVRRYLSNGQMPPVDAVRIEELVNYFDYEYQQPTGNTPISIFMEAGDCPWNKQHKLVHIGIQGKTIPTNNLPASNLVFLIDVSGSMGTPNKLPLVTESFKILTEQLRQQDRVAIVVYAGSSGLVLGSTSGSNKESINAALERLQSGGSTAGAQGIQQAYNVARENFIKGGNNRVILATDGDFNVGVSSDAELVRLIEKERESGVFLSVLGFGMGNYKDNKMQELADHGNGNHSYVDNLSEARKVFVHEFGGTLFTIAKDVKIQVEFNPSLVAGYRLIGYENRLLENEDFNDDKKDAGEIGSGHTVTALYEIIPAGVASSFLTSVDELKYQKTENELPTLHKDELMTVKFRYKDPEGEVSKLLQKIVPNSYKSFTSTSDNFRWSAAIASFGMLLRDSEFSGTSSYANVEAWAKGAIGKDLNGYRNEFLKLVRETEDLTATEEASR